MPFYVQFKATPGQLKPRSILFINAKLIRFTLLITVVLVVTPLVDLRIGQKDASNNTTQVLPGTSP